MINRRRNIFSVEFETLELQSDKLTATNSILRRCRFRKTSLRKIYFLERWRTHPLYSWFFFHDETLIERRYRRCFKSRRSRKKLENFFARFLLRWLEQHEIKFANLFFVSSAGSAFIERILAGVSGNSSLAVRESILIAIHLGGKDGSRVTVYQGNYLACYIGYRM